MTGYYVFLIRDSRHAPLLGPFPDYDAALARKADASAAAIEHDPYCIFDLFLVKSLTADTLPAGKLNTKLGFVPV